MLTERQVRELLQQCERRLGPLEVLRARLLHQREVVSSVFELLVLHSALQAGNATHEQEEAQPDVVYSYNCDPVYLEVSWAKRRFEREAKDLDFLPCWIRNELKKARVQDAARIVIRVDRASRDKRISIPTRNTWRRLIAPSRWRDFVEACVKSPAGPSLAIDDEAGNPCLRVSCHGLSRPGYSSSSSFVVDSPDTPRDHAVYRKLQSKAEQIERWKKKGTAFSPLCVVLGSDEGVVTTGIGGAKISPIHALYAAILDARREHFTTIYNYARYSPPLIPRGKRSRDDNLFISETRHISAFILVSIENDLSHPFGSVHRRAISKLLVNPSAEIQLTQEQVAALSRLRFAHAKLGPGWESWIQTGAVLEHDAYVRSRYEGGTVVMSLGNKPSVEVPASAFELILSGEFSAKEYWDRHGDSTLNDLKRFVIQGRRIENVEYVPGDALQRVEPRIRVTFGLPESPVLMVKPVAGGDELETTAS